ncbi:MAG: rod shape-determining protein MreD [Succinivibrio sp.]|nr:rod shape-determining protein MreD [Succinivibrio sp.]MCI7773007.1 rod shape-determining protein MreD [Succinivibrio sp.]MCI7785431.1 rod shape-determining protein MreD [Succinivibrio sp.]MDY5188695.1 rod shape-determining protein MreD [Succinivibrio sp.]MDY5324617.1 rod shape-determining protein MreD [Succinivibrio sp.]
MINKEKNSSALIVLIPSLLVALILQIVHLPTFLSDNRPDLLTLIILYFSMTNRIKLSLELAFFVGLTVDLITGSPLGIHVFTIALQVYLISSQFNFEKYKIYQQVLIVAIVNLVTNCIGYWLEHLIGQRYYEINFLYPALITALCWPLIYLVLQILCATFSVVTDKDNID